MNSHIKTGTILNKKSSFSHKQKRFCKKCLIFPKDENVFFNKGLVFLKDATVILIEP